MALVVLMLIKHMTLANVIGHVITDTTHVSTNVLETSTYKHRT